MYRTCLFCHASLGANEVVEHFPVGRRLAFDASRGRLWVVCKSCGRWNLTPLEERWEAIEECERRFRGTRLRFSTDNIGLARLREGLELVRIGAPQRPELAAWRYGDQFGVRRRRWLRRSAAATAAAAVILVGAPLLGVSAGLLGVIPWWAYHLVRDGAQRPVAVPHPEGGSRVVWPAQLPLVRIIRQPRGEGWGLEVPSVHVVETAPDAVMRHLRPRRRTLERAILTGSEALRAAGLLLPRINAGGASASHVQSAVRQLERAGGTDPYFRAAATGALRWSERTVFSDPGTIQFLPIDVRLALEMAAHEESERAALEGELAALEAAWRQAEEIAAVADGMFLPRRVSDVFDRLKQR